MKLNLWMIANQLTQYDTDINISSSTFRTISGPLPVSTIGSLYVRSRGTDVICYSEQGTIVIHDMDESEGFLLIQSIFNWYDSWVEEIEVSLQNNDFGRFVHLCSKAFSNPVLFLDSNHGLLGMDCRDIGIDAVPEWKYIYENEQCSVAFFNTMTAALQHPDREYGSNVSRFNIVSADEAGAEFRTSGLHANLRYQASDYGKLIVLDKKRVLNPGDVALMEVISQKVSVLLAASAKNSESAMNIKVLNTLLEGGSVPRETVYYNSSLIKGLSPESSSTFCLFNFRLNLPERNCENEEFLQHIISRQYPAAYTWIYHDELLALVSTPKPHVLIQQISKFLGSQGYQKRVRIGVSLSFEKLEDLAFYYNQTIFALDEDDGQEISFFYNCAHSYLLGGFTLEQKLLAAEPMCRKIWLEQPEKRDFLNTVQVYLECERATGIASDRLFIHRNTLNYRVNFLKEYADWDYDDANLRDYIRLSVYYLAYADKKDRRE